MTSDRSGLVMMPIKCRKCGFENPSTMDYCGNCGCSFDGTEKAVPIPKHRGSSPSPMAELGRVSLLLYFGVALIALSGLLYASAVVSVHGGHMPSSFSDYAQAIGAIGLAIALVGLTRQAKRMRE